MRSGAAFSKVPRKILGKLLILVATDTQVATSIRHPEEIALLLNIVLINQSILFGELIGNCVVVVVVVVISFPKIFLGTFENAALGVGAYL